jgi:hypothetical protein
MKLRILCDGRTIEVLLPREGDVTIDLGRGGAKVRLPIDLSTPGRKLLHRLLQDARTAGGGRVVVEVPAYCERLCVTPSRLGRSIGQLERAALISKTRKRNRQGKVTVYEIEVLADLDLLAEELAGVEHSPAQLITEWSMVLAAIGEAIGDEAVGLFQALCRLADIDGGVMASADDIMGMMDCDDVPVSTLLDALEEHEWIVIQEGDGLLCATVSNFQHLRERGMPKDAWTKGQPQLQV